MSHTYENIIDLYNDKDFNTNYKLYKLKNKTKTQNLIEFLNCITIDKFELPKTTHSISNKNIDSQINSYLNKLSHNNIDHIASSIKSLLKQSHNYDNITNNILDKCLLHKNYTKYYLKLLTIIFIDVDYDYKSFIYTYLDNFVFPTFEISDDYDTICNNNKKNEKILGYSTLVSESESSNIITNRVYPLFDNFIKYYNDDSNSDNKYRYITNVYILLTNFFNNKDIDDIYLSRLNDILKNEKNLKCKFKILDIIERK